MLDAMQFGKIDAYCVLSFNSTQHRTETKKKNYDPVFNVSEPSIAPRLLQAWRMYACLSLT
jgi:hypothetical protein